MIKPKAILFLTFISSFSFKFPSTVHAGGGTCQNIYGCATGLELFWLKFLDNETMVLTLIDIFLVILSIFIGYTAIKVTKIVIKKLKTKSRND